MPYSREDEDWIQEHLKTIRIGKNIITQNVADSTQELAKQLVSKYPEGGTVVLADQQTSGRGRMGRTWQSDEDVGIYLSVILPAPPRPEQVSLLALMAAVVLVTTINRFIQPRATLKWPNDVLITDKKVSGILSEYLPVSPQNPGAAVAIVGIGINVNQERFPAPLDQIATSMRMEDEGLPLDRNAVVAELINQLDAEYDSFRNNGMGPVVARWSENTEMFERHVTVRKGQETLSGTALRLDADGRLVVLADSGEELHLDSGEVTLRE